MPFMQPDRFFSRITRIDVQRDLLACGRTHVLLDVDNTILSRATGEVPRDVGVWLGRARTAGVSFCLVSNNWHQNVFDLAAELELPLVARSVKPLPPAFLLGMSKIGAKRRDTVVVGDQLITDCMGGHFLGIPVYMVLPLVEQDLKHTLMLRHVEKLFIGGLRPEDEPEGVPGGVVACAPDGGTAENLPSKGVSAGPGTAHAD